MATDFLFEFYQWVELHWKPVTGSGRNSRFIPGETVIDIVVWRGTSTAGWKAPLENSGSQKELMEEFSLVQPPVRDTREDATGEKVLTQPTYPPWTPCLVFKWTNQEKKIKLRKRTSKNKSLNNPLYIINKHRTATLKKIKPKTPSSDNFKQKKWKRKKKDEEKRKEKRLWNLQRDKYKTVSIIVTLYIYTSHIIPRT